VSKSVDISLNYDQISGWSVHWNNVCFWPFFPSRTRFAFVPLHPVTPRLSEEFLMPLILASNVDCFGRPGSKPNIPSQSLRMLLQLARLPFAPISLLGSARQEQCTPDTGTSQMATVFSKPRFPRFHRLTKSTKPELFHQKHFELNLCGKSSVGGWFFGMEKSFRWAFLCSPKFPKALRLKGRISPHFLPFYLGSVLECFDRLLIDDQNRDGGKSPSRTVLIIQRWRL
jgi:hypothetical protein